MVGSILPSHVLLAMGVETATALATVRFSMGHSTTEADIDRAAVAVTVTDFPLIVTVKVLPVVTLAGVMLFTCATAAATSSPLDVRPVRGPAGCW